MEEDFSPQQSLRVIQSMIEKTKDNISENRFYFLLWGWLSFVCILAQFVLKVLVEYRHHYIVWASTLVATAITAMHAIKHDRKGTRTYAGDSMGYLWTGIGISFFVLSIIISNTGGGWLNAYPFFILFYGLGTFVSGRLLQFRPLMIGGIINWGLAVAAVFVHFDYQMLIAAVAILTSYIIPGHMIKPAKPAYATTR
jgi:hypothetical protein